MQRTISSKKYVLALVLTILIFSIGVLVGMFFEDLRLSRSEKMILEEKTNLQSLQLQQRFIESGVADCTSLNKVLEANLEELTKKMGQVIGYNKNAIFNQDELRLQVQDYFLTEIQFLLLAQSIDQKCSPDSVKIIFFYDENKFDTQGEILDYLKKLLGPEVLIFSFDSNFKDEPMIDILITSYKINTFPSVVVGNTVFQGHTSMEILREEICGQLRTRKMELPEACQVK